jgi:outer membrane protein assembly factor BamD (BamD/ComL family)
MFVGSIEVTMIKCVRFIVLITALFCAKWSIINAQPYSTVDLYGKKPKQYENRTLTSESSGETGFSGGKHFFQNMFTHFNYEFNINTKVNEIIDRAKLLNKDDYTKLLTFYNYSFDNTAKEKVQIDSIMYKVAAGVLLHDLRNDWIDNIYILMGRTFLLKKNFDSAGYVFQYVNYAWAPKDDGYDIPIGSNISNDKGVFSISTVEKKKEIDYSLRLKTPPSRNESFLWRTRTYLEQDRIAKADALLAILKIDPYFPKRLQLPLEEMLAYSYYKKQQWDSSAFHLERALDDADGPLEYARWEYLIGQMYHLAGDNDLMSAHFFESSISHTTDPLMEVFARLSLVGLHSKDKGYTLQNSIDELYKLAKKDKFVNVRDVIYYVAGKLELENKNRLGAIIALHKSLNNYNPDNPEQKPKTFLLLADTYFDNKDYKLSYNYYDSIKATKGLSSSDSNRIAERKPALKIITENLDKINQQDSLQRVANMSDPDRRAFIKKILKRLRKEQGIKEEEAIDYGLDNGSQSDLPTTLFTSTVGEFYFDNAQLVATGGRDFKAKWGTRPNVDNWQRQDAITAKAVTQGNADTNPGDMSMSPGSDVEVPGAKKAAGDSGKLELTYEGLMRNLPLRPEQKIKSDSIIAKAMFENGTIFQNNLREFVAAIYSYEPFVKRYPEHNKVEQATYNLIFCYEQLGLEYQADSIGNYLKNNFPDGTFTADLLNEHRKDVVVDDTTATYQKIYYQFVDEKYDEAKLAKAAADKKYGTSHWTPQLLLIESVYYIKQEDDFKAINKLELAKAKVPNTPLAEKAQRMIDFLRLRGLRRADSLAAIIRAQRIKDSLSHINYDSLRMIQLAESLKKQHIADSLLKAHIADSLNKVRISDALRKQHTADSLRKAFVADSLWKSHIEDSLNRIKIGEKLRKQHIADSLRQAALAESLRKQHIADSLRKAALAESLRQKHIADSLRKASLAESLRKQHYDDSLRKAALAESLRQKHIADSLAKANLAESLLRKKHIEDSLSKARMADAIRRARIADSLRRANHSDDTAFIYEPNEPHYATIELDDVLKVFINTSTDAFSKFNTHSFKDDIEIYSNKINDRYAFIYFGPFANAKAAIDYINKIKPYVSKTIIPWLPKSRYRYSIISERNLLLLQDNKDVDRYNKFLNKVLPNKF